jgi:hypothetical protein
MEKNPVVPFCNIVDIDKLKIFRQKQKENKNKEKEKKEEKDSNNIPYYAYNCNFIF